MLPGAHHNPPELWDSPHRQAAVLLQMDFRLPHRRTRSSPITRQHTPDLTAGNVIVDVPFHDKLVSVLPTWPQPVSRLKRFPTIHVNTPCLALPGPAEHSLGLPSQALSCQSMPRHAAPRCAPLSPALHRPGVQCPAI